jgi:integrase
MLGAGQEDRSYFGVAPMRLTTAKIQNTPPQKKTARLFDGRGLYLEIAPTGSRWWRFKYRFAGKEKRISLGVYPDVGLKKARDRRDDMRKLVADGIDPSAARKQEKLMALDAALNTFEAVAREWFEKYSPNWEASYSKKLLARLEANIFPWLGHRPIRDIKAPELLSVLRRVESRGVLETAHRLMNYCGNIYRYAVATGRAERDISADLRGALPPSTPRHHASVTEPRDVAALLRAIDGYRGSNVTRYALQLAPLVFVRPGELRKAEWIEIDLEAGEWRMPAERMKMKAKHIVPLSMQAVAILGALQPLTGKGRYVFPGARSLERCMSENTVNGGLRRLGWSGSEMTGHGFRSMASTLLNEQGWNRDAIERQLAHSERNSIRAAYNPMFFLIEQDRFAESAGSPDEIVCCVLARCRTARHVRRRPCAAIASAAVHRSARLFPASAGTNAAVPARRAALSRIP